MQRLLKRTKLLYGAGEFFNGTSTVIVLMLYLKFLTDVVGLAPIWAGFCVVIGKLWDALSDPLIGAISDSTVSRFGRRRIYFLVFCLPASLSFAAMWLVFDEAPTWARIAYYSTSYLTFKTLSTLLNVPYQALGPELTDDYNERTSLVAFRMAFSIGGAILAGVIPNAVVAHFEQIGRGELGHLLVAALFGALYIFVWLLLFAKVPEPAERAEKTRLAFWRSLGLTLKNRSFRILIAVYLGAFLALDTLTAAAKFYVDEYLHRPGLMPAVMGTMLTVGLLSVPLYNVVVERQGRIRAFIWGAGLWATGCVGLLLLPHDAAVLWVIVPITFIGAGIGAAFVVPWSALPEVIDVDRAVNGRSSEGVFTGVMTFLRKASTTLAIFGLSAALQAAGYRANLDSLQSEAVTDTIRLATGGAPILLIGFAAFWMRRYPISKDSYDLLRQKLAEGGHLDVTQNQKLERFLKRAY